MSTRTLLWTLALALLAAPAAAAQGANQAPVAKISSVTIDGLTATADGSASSDADGQIVSYVWDWGDGSPLSTGVKASHAYKSRGFYTIRLIVTDDKGATHTSPPHRAGVTGGGAVAPNQPAVARFDVRADQLAVQVDASASTDDGRIDSYLWAWGDGTIGGGVKASHAYAEPGTYTIYLLVTDDRGLRSNASRQVTLPASGSGDGGTGTGTGSGAGNETGSGTGTGSGVGNETGTETGTGSGTGIVHDPPPLAQFDVTIDGLVVKVDASASADPDGEIASWSWDWGDGGPLGSGRLAEYEYLEPGTYVVRLTVVGSNGASATSTREVVATGGQAPILTTIPTQTPGDDPLDTASDGGSSGAPSSTPPTRDAPATPQDVASQDAREAPGAGLALALIAIGAAALVGRRRG